MIDLRTLRSKQGLRQIDVADKLGKYVTTIANWEKGRESPKMMLEEFSYLADLYQCSLDELLLAIKESEKGCKDGRKNSVRPEKPRRRK
jgi:transcriptional regulator with XRE-family HTH domain